MPQQAVVERAGAASDQGGREARAALIPFVRASHRVVEGPFMDVSNALVTTGPIVIQPQQVPARGYVRAIWLLCEGTGGVIGAGVLHEDYPFGALNSIALREPNGTERFGPMSGYHAYLTNLFGGYAFEPDITAHPDYVGTINFNFALRIPVEITPRDGFGAIANQNAQAPPRLAITLATAATSTTGPFTTTPTTPPTVRIRGYTELWAQPPSADPFGNPNQVEPPAHGLAQFWSEQQYDPLTGQQTIRLVRTGNLWRALIMVERNATGTARSTTNFPDPIRFIWDSREVKAVSRQYLRQAAYEVTGRTPPTGVFLLPFHDDDGHAGNEARNLYLPTVDASRLELSGSFGADSLLTVLTNDIAPLEAPVRAAQS